MPPPPLLDLSKIDFDRILYRQEQIYEVLPQRHEFAHLDAIVHLDLDSATAVAFREIRADEWWCKGHFPDRPLFPGILMVETAAQLAAFVQHRVSPSDDTIMGFGGIDQVKFRGSVVPPCRLVVVGRAADKRPRRFIYEVQGFVKDAMVFEGLITGIPLKM